MAIDLQAFWQEELDRFLPEPSQALREALEYVCCPVCQVLAGLPFDYFRLVSARWPEETRLREVVIAAGGFCNPHSWRLMSMQSSVAIARVFVDILAGLAQTPSATRTTCPVCYLEQIAGEVLLDALAEHLEKQSERECFGELFGLCYPHWGALLGRDLSAPLRQFLIESQVAATTRLQQQTQGFLDKAAIELKWTRTRDENRAPRRALLKTAGNEGL